MSAGESMMMNDSDSPNIHLLSFSETYLQRFPVAYEISFPSYTALDLSGVQFNWADSLSIYNF